MGEPKGGRERRHKYVFVVGGVMSGVGKGIATSSIGTILKAKGYRVSLMKADPYLNVDAGTMNPTEHGEVFVMDSGLETDQDMGNYERFLGMDLPKESYLTNGMVLKYVIEKERALGYRGKCVEPVYHVTEEILRRIEKAREKTKAEITVLEIGGTIGEYQNAIFLEAARLLKVKHPKDVIFVMVSYLPVPGKIGEMKTKLTQNAVRQLSSYGINTDIIIARSELPIDDKRKEKIAIATGIEKGNIIAAPDIESVYDVPLNFETEGLSIRILESLGLKQKRKDLHEWRRFVTKTKNTRGTVNIAVVGKYFDTGDFVLSDAYVSVIEAVKFSSYSEGVKANLVWINAKDYESGKRKISELKRYDGVLVPGGFGSSGVEGIISAIRFAREEKIPYLGLCYGMQLAVVEFARNVAKLKNANTTEIDGDTPHPVIGIMDEQEKKMLESNFGGSMRLGAYVARLSKNSIAYKAYRKDIISERHRHRYEVNPLYIKELSEAGLIFSGTSPDMRLMEIMELPKPKHPFFLATQFHPEFKARPLEPHPVFTAFIRATKSINPRRSNKVRATSKAIVKR